MAHPPFKRGGVLDSQLEDLIEASSWKQAVALCEKRIKKGSKSDESLVAKAHVLLLCPDTKRQEQGRKELKEIIEKEAITDPDLLVHIAIFADHRREPFNIALWQSATRAQPKNEALYKNWFYTAFATKEWDVAQKASAAYRRAFPKRREAHMWYIITTHILTGRSSVTEKDRATYAQLNYRILAQVASTSGTASNTGLSLECLEDLLLLLKVYRLHGKAKEALDILDDDRIGINSPIGNKAWELVRHKIDLLEESGQYEKQWRFCHALLDDARPDEEQEEPRPKYLNFGRIGDDWKVWTGLIEAAIQIDTEEKTKITEIFIETYSKRSRNAQLALLKFYSISLDEGAYTQSRLLAASSAYFRNYARRVVCFYDLNPSVISLGTPNQVELLKLSAQEAKCRKPRRDDVEMKAVQWLTSEINALKLDYYLVISKHPHYYEKSLLEAFVCNCLRLYRLSRALGSKLPPSERRPGDDAALLAVMALLHTADVEDQIVVIRCITILEIVITASRHNYDALLLLVRLHLLLGTGGMAVDRYSRLCVKNIQHASISWILLTRISTLHPYSLSPPSIGKDWFIIRDPSENITAVLDWHRSAEVINDKSVNKMLKDGQYNMLLDALDLGHTIESGFAKLIAFVELSRMQRLGAISGEMKYSDLLHTWKGDARDNRDIGAFPSCESRFQDSRTRSMMDGWFTTKHLNGRWLSQQLDITRFWEFVNRRSTINVNATKAMRDREPVGSHDSTVIEYKEFYTISILENLCSLAASLDSSRTKQPAMLELFETLEEDLAAYIKSLDNITNVSESRALTTRFGSDFRAPNHNYYHLMFIILDVCQICRTAILYLENAVRENPFLDPKILAFSCKRIELMILRMAAQTEISIASQKTLFQDGNATAQVERAIRWGPHDEQDMIGRELDTIIDPTDLEQFAANICENWMDALNGVLKTKAFINLTGPKG